MSSLLKSETARTNGAKSRGPVTPEGKARSAANSRRHGLAAASILVAGESDELFQLLRADFMDQFQPQTAVETDLVDVMAIARWRLRRLLAIEAHLFDRELVRGQEQIDAEFTDLEPDDRLAWAFQKMSDTGTSLALVIRYEGSLNRSYDKALKHLLLLQSTRPPKKQNEPSPTPDDPASEPLDAHARSTPCDRGSELAMRKINCLPSRDRRESIYPAKVRSDRSGRESNRVVMATAGTMYAKVTATHISAPANC
jgi:hypothetical protein